MTDRPGPPPGEQRPPGPPHANQPGPDEQPGQQGGGARDWLTNRVRDLIRLHEPPPHGAPPPPRRPPIVPPQPGSHPADTAGARSGRHPNEQRPRSGGGGFHNPEQAEEIAQAVGRAREWWKIHRSDVFGVPFRQQTYLNMVYLLLQFPLGLAYFLIIALGLILGASLVPILIGFVILFFTLTAASALGRRERRIARRLLGVTIPEPIEPDDAERSRFRRLTSQLRDQTTWTILLYLVLKFPLGIVTFFLTVSLTIWTVGEAIGVNSGLYTGGPWSPGAAPFFFVRAVIYGYISLHVINGVAFLSGRLARHMLGPSDTAIQLAATEQVAVEEREKAERADQSRRELIVNVSHELRTPTASIRGHVESLLMSLDNGQGRTDAVEPGQLHNYLNIIHRETERLSTLVDDLLTLARSESDELRLVVQPASVQDVVAEVHETLAPLAWRQRSITLVQDVQPNLPKVWADRQRLLQVLLNLVRNAITHTPAGGIVSIGLSSAGPHYVALIVADTGSGIPPDEIDHIFERFYRVDVSRTRSSGGFGLGLAIVKELVTAMGGTVAVSSKVGEGSAFRVLLRVAEAGASAPAPTPTNSSPAAPASEGAKPAIG